MEVKYHLTEKGFKAVVEWRASLNLGLSEELVSRFPDINPALPVDIQNILINRSISIPHQMWIAGFVTGEGSFFVNIFKSTHHKLGYQVRIEFELAQHIREELLMKSFISYFGCGIISNYSKDMIKFKCTKFMNVQSNIIPLFKEYSIDGVKLLDFNDFCEVGDIMSNGAHLTQQGLDKIRAIKAGMNTGRPFLTQDCQDSQDFVFSYRN